MDFDRFISNYITIYVPWQVYILLFCGVHIVTDICPVALQSIFCDSNASIFMVQQLGKVNDDDDKNVGRNKELAASK